MSTEQLADLQRTQANRQFASKQGGWNRGLCRTAVGFGTRNALLYVGALPVA